MHLNIELKEVRFKWKINRYSVFNTLWQIVEYFKNRTRILFQFIKRIFRPLLLSPKLYKYSSTSFISNKPNRHNFIQEPLKICLWYLVSLFSGLCCLRWPTKRLARVKTATSPTGNYSFLATRLPSIFTTRSANKSLNPFNVLSSLKVGSLSKLS